MGKGAKLKYQRDFSDSDDVDDFKSDSENVFEALLPGKGLETDHRELFAVQCRGTSMAHGGQKCGFTLTNICSY
jgi:hypothetical protein